MNHYWRNLAIGGRARTVISEEGRRFRAQVKDLAWAGNLPTIAGPCAVTISAYMPDKRRRDLDNLLKATLDALVHAAVIDDDSHISDLRITRAGHEPGGYLLVTITQ